MSRAGRSIVIGVACESDTAERVARTTSEPAGGDLDLEGLYQEEAPRLRSFFARRTGSREDAADLVQEAFSRLISFGASNPGRIERPQAYLSRTARNLLYDRSRSRSREPIDHAATVEASAWASDPEPALESRDALRRLEAAMLRLKPKTREIFMAHRLDGMSYAEIAERTGLSVKGVEKQMSKAIAHLDRLLSRR